MLKELIIKQDDVIYGETAAGADVTINTIALLADGNFAVFTADGQLISRTGTIATLANLDVNEPFTLYAKENGLLRAVNFIGKGNAPAFSNAAVAKVMTFDTDNFPTSRTEVKPTGLIIVDADKNPHDPRSRSRAELPVDDDVTAAGAANYEGDLVTLLGNVDGIASAVGDTAGEITITLDAGRNLNFVATGYLEGVPVTVTSAIEFASTLTAAEMAELEREVQSHDGRTQHDLLGSHTDMWSKASLVETGATYYVNYLRYIIGDAELLDGAKEAIHTMCVASPDSVPGGSDANGTWAALIGAMADASVITQTP